MTTYAKLQTTTKFIRAANMFKLRLKSIWNSWINNLEFLKQILTISLHCKVKKRKQLLFYRVSNNTWTLKWEWLFQQQNVLKKAKAQLDENASMIAKDVIYSR